MRASPLESIGILRRSLDSNSMTSLPEGERRVVILIVVSTEYRHLPDGRTDRQEDRQKCHHNIAHCMCERVRFGCAGWED